MQLESDAKPLSSIVHLELKVLLKDAAVAAWQYQASNLQPFSPKAQIANCRITTALSIKWCHSYCNKSLMSFASSENNSVA